MLDKQFDKRIAELATERQLDYYKSYCTGNSIRQVGRSMGITESVVRRSLKYLEKKAAKRDLLENHSPEYGVAHGFALKGTSTLYDGSGEKLLQWVKTKEDVESLQARMEEFCAILREITPVRTRAIKPPTDCLEDLMSVYPLPDAHIGLYAWAEESGENFDCDICEALITQAIDRLVNAQPHAKIGRVENLGDFFHSDNNEAMTARSGNHLDVDGRWGRVLRIGVRMIIHCIDRCLEHHECVEVVNEIGNHDDYTAYCLAIILDHHYKEEPRVIVETKYAKFHYREFGSVLIGTSHGMIKPEALHRVMTSDQPEAWGRTKYRYWHVGHLHHSWSTEIGGVLIEGFRSLKSKDAYEAEKGYRAGRSMSSILYHRNYGQIERHTCNLERLM